MAVFSVTEAMVSWLSGMGYRASSREPRDCSGEHLTVERVGGRPRSLVDHASMAVQAWADSDDAAEARANRARLAVLTAAPPAGVHSVRVESGPYQHYDDATHRPRYQFVLDVSCQLQI